MFSRLSPHDLTGVIQLIYEVAAQIDDTLGRISVHMMPATHTNVAEHLVQLSYFEAISGRSSQEHAAETMTLNEKVVIFVKQLA